MTSVPELRLRPGNRKALNPQGSYVLYWMTAFRRLGWNFALQRAVELGLEAGRPLVILEALRVDYPYASPRLHRFMLQGMGERHASLRGSFVLHYPFVERSRGEGKGLLSALAEDAVAVVTDDYPSFFLPRMVAAAGRALDVRLELVDSNGLLPLRAGDRSFTAAFHFRRFLQKHLPEHLFKTPDPIPLEKGPPPGPAEISPAILERWPSAPPDLLSAKEEALWGLPLDSVVPSVPAPGGTAPARLALKRFLEQNLQRYAQDRNHPDLDVTSGLSPYLHFGNISAHEVFARVAEWEGWTPLRLSERADGARAGWWGMGEGAEAFLDQLVTWRELGFHTAARSPAHEHTKYESLPDWARTTLEEHQGDPRPHLYTQDELAEAATADPLWNAAQRQLLHEGVIHNYLRMLWGKKILEWTATPRQALEVMIELNDRYALDGRDPNSYSGIFWCLGRYDRGWPERPVFGKVRSMTSASTRRKVKIEKFLERFGS